MTVALLVGLVLLLIFGAHIPVTWSGVALFFLGYFWCLSAAETRIAKLRSELEAKPRAADVSADTDEEEIVYGLPAE